MEIYWQKNKPSVFCGVHLVKRKWREKRARARGDKLSFEMAEEQIGNRKNTFIFGTLKYHAERWHPFEHFFGGFSGRFWGIFAASDSFGVGSAFKHFEAIFNIMNLFELFQMISKPFEPISKQFFFEGFKNISLINENINNARVCVRKHCYHGFLNVLHLHRFIVIDCIICMMSLANDQIENEHVI